MFFRAFCFLEYLYLLYAVNVGLWLLGLRVLLSILWLSLQWYRIDVPVAAVAGLPVAWDWAHATYLALVHQHLRYQAAPSIGIQVAPINR